MVRRIMKFMLYRGIATSNTMIGKVIQKILVKGLFVGQGNWILRAPDLCHTDLHELIHDPTLSTTMTREREAETFAATGDYDTALYYACKHNQTKENTEGILIEFSVPINRIFVDGRDFLYTVFQGFDARNDSETHKKKVKNILRRIFGSAITPYIDEVFKTPRENQSRRIALVDIAINDRNVIVVHKKNKIWINGRYGTWFCSSFLVEGKIPPEDIVKVEHVKCAEIVLKKQIPPFVIPDSYVSLSSLV